MTLGLGGLILILVSVRYEMVILYILVVHCTIRLFMLYDFLCYMILCYNSTDDYACSPNTWNHGLMRWKLPSEWKWDPVGRVDVLRLFVMRNPPTSLSWHNSSLGSFPQLVRNFDPSP
jgi:hypothetical protein